jgi:hypothetical protein
MAAMDEGGNFAVTTTAQTLTTALGITSGHKHFSRVSVKLSSAATTTCYLGNSDVTSAGANAHHELEPGRAYDFPGDGLGWLVNTDDIYIAGAEDASNVVFVNCMA